MEKMSVGEVRGNEGEYLLRGDDRPYISSLHTRIRTLPFGSSVLSIRDAR